MDDLNYKHLRYFWVVAREGHLTRAAEKLNVSQSALSLQIKTLEERLGQPLFDRVGRRLVMTEAGRIALDHADRIFSTGAEMLDTLRRGRQDKAPLRVGALSTLSRNFQISFLEPVLKKDNAEVALKSGDADTLFADLRALALDVVLTTEPPEPDPASGIRARRIAEQNVALHGTPARLQHKRLADLLANQPVVLPTEPMIRRGFDDLVAKLGVQPKIVARVDDMAMVRLLARADVGMALAPPVVLADEIATGRLGTAPFDLGISETFYATTVNRSFPHPLLNLLWSD